MAAPRAVQPRGKAAETREAARARGVRALTMSAALAAVLVGSLSVAARAAGDPHAGAGAGVTEHGAAAGAAGDSGAGGAANAVAANAVAGGESGAAGAANGDRPLDVNPGAARTLPPVEPDAAVAPIFKPETQEQPDARPIASEERPEAVLKTVIGLLTLLALAYLGGHARVVKWEKRLGVSQLITAGFPFIVLGMLARLPPIGILTDPVLTELSPLLRIGLGCIGLVAGFRFDARLFQAAPSGTAAAALLSTVLPATFVVGAVAPVLLLWSEELTASNLSDPVFLRDALILSTAGAMTARSAIKWLEGGNASNVIRLEAIAGIAGVAAVASFFRPHASAVTWQLPGVGWLLVTVGLGATLGLCFYAILQTTKGPSEFLVVILGSISFAAGGSGYLHLSSVAVAFVAGVMLANFPGAYHARLREMLGRVERPIYLTSLFVIGALWQVDDWRGWALMPLFATARLSGKWLAALIATRSAALPVSAEEGRVLVVSPIGALAIAIVVNAQLLYPGGSISLIVSAVIGGGVITELFVQLAGRRWLRGAKDGADARESHDYPARPAQ